MRVLFQGCTVKLRVFSFFFQIHYIVTTQYLNSQEEPNVTKFSKTWNFNILSNTLLSLIKVYDIFLIHQPSEIFINNIVFFFVGLCTDTKFL